MLERDRQQGHNFLSGRAIEALVALLVVVAVSIVGLVPQIPRGVLAPFVLLTALAMSAPSARCAGRTGVYRRDPPASAGFSASGQLADHGRPRPQWGGISLEKIAICVATNAMAQEIHRNRRCGRKKESGEPAEEEIGMRAEATARMIGGLPAVQRQESP